MRKYYVLTIHPGYGEIFTEKQARKSYMGFGWFAVLGEFKSKAEVKKIIQSESKKGLQDFFTLLNLDRSPYLFPITDFIF